MVDTTSTEPDGYYGDDEAASDDIDLSFLDEDKS